MLTLDRVIARGSSDTHRVDLPFAGLTRLGYGLVRGQVSMVAAGPGVGKSAWANQVALDSNLRTLYVSADTDSWTMTVRTIAHVSGHPQSYIEQCLEGGWSHHPDVQLALHLASHVQYTFDTYTSEELRDDVAAYGVIHGDNPELIVVDNVANLARGGENEVSSQRKFMDEMHALAQLTGAHVMVLHHSTGAYHDGDKPVPLAGIENKISQLPSHIVTLYRRDPYTHMCVVKNRTGKANPNGDLQIRARFDGERQTFTTDQELS